MLFRSLTREAAPQYHALGAEERAQLLMRVQEAREAYPATLKAWKDSLTPEMIKEENLVRFRRRKLGLSNARKLRLDGEPKRPLTGFMRYVLVSELGGVRGTGADRVGSQV